jgi:hypothetical protein
MDMVKTPRVNDEILLDFKRLERDTGFLVHVCMTYENLRPYLKGFYLAMNEWRYDRDKEGWKLNKQEWEDIADDWMDGSWHWEAVKSEMKLGSGSRAETPNKVRMVPQMIQDVELLAELFKQERPSKRLIRGRGIARILYGFGDASGAGFGASWEVRAVNQDSSGGGKDGPSQIRYRFGRWGGESEGSSSNYRELKNLVESLEEMGKKDELSGVEVFLFTDNSTAEAACARGSSSSRSLFELVKRFKLMEMMYKTRIHVIHVSGKRMIAQGADGLSRGCLSGEGVMRGERMEAFIPLHQSAADRSPEIISWLQDCCDVSGGTPFKLLNPEDWYVLGQDIVGGTRNCDGTWIPTYGRGNYVWAPPPCVALQCLEELRRARHKRQVSSHIFVCPRIMSGTWQRHLYKSADIVFFIPPGHKHWDSNQYEPLMVGLYFPYLAYEPWHLKGSKKILGMGGHLQRMFKTDSKSAGCLLRQLWKLARQLPFMSQQLVLRMLQGPEVVEVSKTTARKRRRPSMEKDQG